MLRIKNMKAIFLFLLVSVCGCAGSGTQTPEYADIRYAGHDGGDFLFVPLESSN